MPKDTFRIFQKLSKKLVTEINNYDFCAARNTINEAKHNYNFSIKKMLRFHIDNANSKQFLEFAKFIDCDKYEINQYNLYFKIIESLTLNKTIQMLENYRFTTILEEFSKDVTNPSDNEKFNENYIDYLNFIINNHGKYYTVAAYIPPFLRKANIDGFYKTSKKEFFIYDCIKNNLNSFRLSYCNIISKDNHFSFEITNEANRIQIANIDADIPTQAYQIFNLAINNSTDFVETAKNITLDLIENRKFYGLDNYNYKSIDLENLVKAYLVIYYESYLSLINGKLLIKKTKDDWINTLHFHGIFNDNTEGFFAIMSKTYTVDPSIDIRDTPLIYYNKFYYSIPFTTLTNDIANIVAFRIKQCNNLKEKGDAFETTTRSRWNKHFKVVHIKETKKGQEFECDMAFVFDDCLFICELKNESQPYSWDDWFRFSIKKEQNLLQIKRITEHFQNSEDLKRKLGKKSTWNPKKVLSLLLYGCKYGIPTTENNVIVANETDIYNFFNRTPIGTHIIDENNHTDTYIKYIEGYNYLENRFHKLTIKDFYEYIKCPMAIKYLLNNNH